MTQNGTPASRAARRSAVAVRSSHVFEADFPYSGKLADLRDLMGSLRTHPDEADFTIDNGAMVIRYSG